MADVATIRQALGQLDPNNDGHWTSQGLPRMDVLAGIVGEQLERKTLNELVPGFSRAVATKTLAEAGEVAQPAAPAPVSTIDDDLRRQADNSFKHKLAAAKRRDEALAHLHAGGFTVADLADQTSPLQRRISAQNNRARRELRN